jgi:hypothetical protein
VRKSLRCVAKGLDVLAAGQELAPAELAAIEQILHARETGFQDIHNVAVADEIMKVLAGGMPWPHNPGNWDTAGHQMRNFRAYPSEIAEAWRKAVKNLANIKGKDGHPRAEWFSDFVIVLKFIAEKNGIKRTVSTNLWTGKFQGRFLELAVGFEKLLHYSMRSKTHDALGQRLKRALRSLRESPSK